MKRLFLLVIIALSLKASAINFEYGYFNPTKKECRLTGWNGAQPEDGILNVPAVMTHTDGQEYKIVAIGRHSLDNLTHVKEIHLSQNIDSIGSANNWTYPVRVMNFDNCPMLEKFVVDKGNTYFSSSAAGMLLMRTSILSVPAKMPVGTGTFTVPKSITNIEEYAFSQNTTIKFLTLYPNVLIERNGGLNDMAQLESIRLSGSGDLTLVDGALVDTYYQKRVVALPRKSTQEKVTLTSDIEFIEEYAFHGCSNLKRVIADAVREVGKDAFSGSGLTSMIFPSTVNEIGKGALAGCRNLQYLRLENNDINLPANFARDCGELKEVVAYGDILDVGKAAFKNCSRLSSFPFSGITKWSGDSSFYGCALKSVDFKPSAYPNAWHGSYQFADNEDLKIIDASSLQDTFNSIFPLWNEMAPDCPNLTVLKLPEFSGYAHKTNFDYSSPFGKTCRLERIEAHSIWSISETSTGKKRQEIKLFYSPGNVSHYSPQMFIAVTANRKISMKYYNKWGLKEMFVGVDGATVTPDVYVDASEPCDWYEDSNISYYVPGGCKENYSLASSIGAKVEEMYSISIDREGGKLLVKVSNEKKSVNGKPFVVDNICFDDVAVKPDSEGYSISQEDAGNISEVVVKYKVDGFKMETAYPKSVWDRFSGVESTVADVMRMRRNGNRLTFECDQPDFYYSVFDIKGSKMRHGNEKDFDLESLSGGIYIIEYGAGGHRKIEKIVK
ncbi:MAG: leucine-rich repeat domain-containing protein [Muribaculaceae bacterium]|nr:leucine-rich repeat domain-containing protein [Muribaculaceae bacterium]